MSVYPGRRQDGPDWGNVASYMRYISRVWNGVVVVTMGSAHKKDDQYSVRWSVRLYRNANLRPGDLRAELWRDYPHREHKTVPGLLYGLLLRLDSELEREAQRASAQQQLPLGE